MEKTEVVLKGNLQATVENIVISGPMEIWKALLFTGPAEGGSYFVGWGESAQDAVIDALQRREYAYEELNA